MANVNIVKDYSWTSLPKGAPLRDEAPVCYVRGFELEGTQLNQFIDGYINIASAKNVDDFYKNLYKGKKKDTYFFPYFSDSVRSFNNEFADSFSAFSASGKKPLGMGAIETYADEIGAAGAGFAEASKTIMGGLNDASQKYLGSKSEVTSAVGKVAGMLGADGGSYIEVPKLYQFANTDAPVDVSFVLSNTVERGDHEKNAKFIEDFIRANRPKRTSSISMTFPQVFKVKIPGVRYIEWAFLSNLSVTFLGTRRLIDGKVYPEGYQIDMSFTSLTIEPENFMDKI